MSLPYDEDNWYFIVLDNPGFVYSTASDSYVADSDPTYLAWVASGGEPGIYNTEEELFEALTPHFGARDLLQEDRTYYVRTDGDDANSGLVNSADGAKLTLNGARDAVAMLDLNGYTVTIQIADGTTYGSLNWASSRMPVGAGIIIIQGNAGTPANVRVSATSDNAMTFSGAPRSLVFRVKDLELRTTTSGTCLLFQYGTVGQWSNIRFGACAGSQIEVRSGANATGIGNYTISGSAVEHFRVRDPGSILQVNAMTVTLSGTPNFSSVFLNALVLSYTELVGNTFSGSATGIRYSVTANAIVGTGGATLPGDSAGSTGTGGQYS